MQRLEGCFRLHRFYRRRLGLTSVHGRTNIFQLSDRVRDALRIVLYTRWVIENAPLQAYTSALVFIKTSKTIRVCCPKGPDNDRHGPT